jgi:ComF family protein
MEIANKIKYLFKNLIDYIMPLRCSSCAAFIVTNSGFCADCFGKLNFITNPYCKLCGHQLEFSIFTNMECGKCLHNKPSFDIARSLMKFDEHSQKIIYAFKYYDQMSIAHIFAKMLCQRYIKEIFNADLVVPVPMHKFKRLFRKYNPSQILADSIAQIIHKPLRLDLLIKSKWTKSQTALSKVERQKNLSNSFACNSKYLIHNQNILLIDDVFTTGTTVQKCSQILKLAGAASIIVLTIVRT